MYKAQAFLFSLSRTFASNEFDEQSCVQDGKLVQ